MKVWLAILVLGMSVSRGAPVTVKDTRPVLTESQVDRWTRLWQKRLGLTEWDITTLIVRSWELKPETLGNLKWNAVTHSAVIRVLNPLDYELPAHDIPEDIEFTILHELIHLQLAVLPRDPGSRNIEEQVVNRMADALFSLEKGDTYRSHAVAWKPSKPSRQPYEASRSN